MPNLEKGFVLEPEVALPVISGSEALEDSGPGGSPRLSRAFSVVVVLLVLVQIGICWFALPAVWHGRIDFRAFYTTGRLLVHGNGHQIYSYAVQQTTQNAIFPAGFKTLPFLYPAYAAVLFAPFALASYRAAFLLFCGLNFVCLAFAGPLLCARVASLRGLPRVFQFGLLLAFFPLSNALLQGQISIVLLLLYIALDRLLARRMDFLAGLVLALGLVKFQIALPVALLFLAWGCYRLIAGLLCGAAGLALASLAVCGREGMVNYWDSTRQMAGRTLLDPAAAKLHYGMFAGDMPNLHGLFFTLARGRLWGSGLAIAISIGVMVWAWRQRPSIAVALPAAMLVSYHMQGYDLVMLLLPLALAFSQLPERQTQATRWLLVASLVLLTVPVAAFLLVKGLLCVMALAVMCVLIAGRNAGMDDRTSRLGAHSKGRWAGGRFLRCATK